METIKGTAPDFSSTNPPSSSPHSNASNNIVTEPGKDPRVPAVSASDDSVIGFVKNGVITPRGILRKGDSIVFEGEKDTVQNIDVVRGTISLGSGKKVQK